MAFEDDDEYALSCEVCASVWKRHTFIWCFLGSDGNRRWLLCRFYYLISSIYCSFFSSFIRLCSSFRWRKRASLACSVPPKFNWCCLFHWPNCVKREARWRRRLRTWMRQRTAQKSQCHSSLRTVDERHAQPNKKTRQKYPQRVRISVRWCSMSNSFATSRSNATSTKSKNNHRISICHERLMLCAACIHGDKRRHSRGWTFQDSRCVCVCAVIYVLSQLLPNTLPAAVDALTTFVVFCFVFNCSCVDMNIWFVYR